jgi:hypothetical protein
VVQARINAAAMQKVANRVPPIYPSVSNAIAASATATGMYKTAVHAASRAAKFVAVIIGDSFAETLN